MLALAAEQLRCTSAAMKWSMLTWRISLASAKTRAAGSAKSQVSFTGDLLTGGLR